MCLLMPSAAQHLYLPNLKKITLLLFYIYLTQLISFICANVKFFVLFYQHRNKSKVIVVDVSKIPKQNFTDLNRVICSSSQCRSHNRSVSIIVTLLHGDLTFPEC